MLKVYPGTYGSDQRPCIYIQPDANRPDREFILEENMDANACKLILAYIEYSQQRGVPFEVTGFRTNKELYPDG